MYLSSRIAQIMCATVRLARLTISAMFSKHKYEDAAGRVAKASRAIRGEDNQALGNALRIAAGIGVGIGVGLLLAPASGQETRSAIAGGVRQFGNEVRKQVFSERPRAAANAG